MIIWSSCVTSRKIISNPKPIEKQDTIVPSSPVKDYLEQKIVFNTFSGKASCTFSNKEESHDFTMNLRMQKDKAIWSMVTAWSIVEVARAYLTPDSLKVVLKQDKAAYALSYKEGLELLKADIGFSALQNLVAGNILIEDAVVKDITQNDSMLVVTMNKEDYTQRLTFGKKDKLLQQQEISSEEREFDCIINYHDFKAMGSGKQLFPFKRNVSITSKDKQLKLEMNFGKAETDIPVDMPFSIPAGYKMLKSQ